MIVSLILFILGFLKLITGIDLIAFAFLYFLIFKQDFDLRELVVFMFFAELFNASIYGLYLVSFAAIYFLFKRHRKFFHPSMIFDFCFFSLSFLLIRIFYNFPFILEYKVAVPYYIFNFIKSLIFVGVFFWLQYWLEKCLAKFIKLP